ncbi:ELG1-like protein [Fusarium heterosporum]|uniref:ELG1-like protein n=1 Tax=Fusarium heterosporum TaxID=42747 RepID=A0A8H5WNB9_FUSHE|nr:ELG1-like protein [Fusarium heterosporum]
MAPEVMRELEAKKVHPFFSKAPVTDLTSSPNPSDPSVEVSSNEPLHEDNQSAIELESGRKRRKTDTTLQHNAPEPKKQRRKRQSEILSIASNATIEQSLGLKTIGPVVAHPSTNSKSDIQINSTESAPQPTPANSSNLLDTDANTNKSKVLRWNPKTGTLGSPPKPKSKSMPARIVCVKYGRDEANRKDLGNKISQILDGKILFPPTPPKRRGRKAKDVSAIPEIDNSKSTHPFFGGKAKQAIKREKNVSANERPPSVRQTVFMSTPMSPRKARNPFIITGQASQFGVRTGVAKVPGAMQPLWPAQGMAHVRGFDDRRSLGTSLSQQYMVKKCKGSTVTVTTDESVLNGLCASMNLAAIRDSLPKNDHSFEPAPRELRIPSRHFESGRKLQKRIWPELRTLKHAIIGQEDGFLDDDTPVAHSRTHPAINRLYDALETRLSAYDKSTCEPLAWTQKYAPVVASEILQAGKEAILLRDWLQTLKVQSVSTASLDGALTKGKPKSKAASKKKRKKDELDDFIVNSEEEANEMDEISENEGDWAPAGSGLLKKTVVRNSDLAKGVKDQSRLTNAVVVSGPHGCGKTATIYAIAKELGFEIFEIHSGSRRSGKDILEKVGDMTRNHLVQQHRANPDSEKSAEDEVSRDLKSGKQGTMTNFFQKSIVSKPLATKPAEEKLAETPKTSSVKGQKQSLILLEEVDVLYEEDKQFWATLMGMMAQSKRPFIMTCSDETMVPFQGLNLHGIFRFSPPPIDLAVDLCLLTAANEGHILRRTAVEALYKSRNNDLRSSLTELNYWCQMGVGDRKGGFDWFYLRWPKGSDLDENGDVVRVLSEDTYCEGMGWIGRDLIVSCSDSLRSEEEAMKQAWDSWSLNLDDWDTTPDLQSWAEEVSRNTSEPNKRLEALEHFDEFCTSMSDADLLSSGSLATGLQEIIDPGLPGMPVKMRDDFIVGRRLLEADPKVMPHSPSIDLSVSLKSIAKSKVLSVSCTLDTTSISLEPLTEKRVIQSLEHSFEPGTPSLKRIDLAHAFDPIAINEKIAVTSYLDPSVFDRTTKLIVLDVAPWVRGIVEFDSNLMQERLKLSNLLSEGGTRKRMRTTRSAYSAMEGGERKTTRRERYFGDSLNTIFVRRTAGKGWQEAAESIAPRETTSSLASSVPSSPGSSEA